jgi:vacuolar iron transporter family protein
MNHAIKKGFGFGLASGVITTLGLMVGLSSGTHESSVVIGGILVIAIADAMSDALGMHISVESEAKRTKKGIWEATIATFVTKFIVAVSFIVPVLLLPLPSAIVVSIVWGLGLISVFSYMLAQQKGSQPYRAVLEHLFIAVIVIIITHYIGSWIDSLNL